MSVKILEVKKENKDKVNKRDYFGFIDGSKELEEKVEEIKKNNFKWFKDGEF